jgi:hypothetical protein
LHLKWFPQTGAEKGRKMYEERRKQITKILYTKGSLRATDNNLRLHILVPFNDFLYMMTDMLLTSYVRKAYLT